MTNEAVDDHPNITYRTLHLALKQVRHIPEGLGSQRSGYSANSYQICSQNVQGLVVPAGRTLVISQSWMQNAL